MFVPLPQITIKSEILKFLNNLRKILQTNISNVKPFLFNFLWCFNFIETQRCYQPLSWSSQIIFSFWIYYFYIFQTTKIQIDVQGDLLLDVIDIPVFLNILMITIFHVHRCEILLTERLPNVETMINIW